MSITDLSAALWRERELLELLAFKLEEEHLLLTAGRTRWLQHATREVESVLERLGEAGLARAVASAAVAQEWNAPHDATLRQLIEAATDETWAELLESHHSALISVTGTIRSLRDENERFLHTASRSVQETLAAAEHSEGRYDAHGAATASAAGGRFFTGDL